MNARALPILAAAVLLLTGCQPAGETIKDIESAWMFIRGMIETGPIGWWAVLTGLLSSLGALLAVRPWVKRHGWATRLAAEQAASFFGAWLMTYWVWPTPAGAKLGVFLGLVSMTVVWPFLGPLAKALRDWAIRKLGNVPPPDGGPPV